MIDPEESETVRNPLIDHMDVLTHVMLFASGEGYLFAGGVSISWEGAWGDRPCETKLDVAMHSESCLAWARDCWCPWDDTTCSLAARLGRLDILQYARAEHCPWGWKTCASAAKGGHLGVLEWCRENECPWNDETFKEAAQEDNRKNYEMVRGERLQLERRHPDRTRQGGTTRRDEVVLGMDTCSNAKRIQFSPPRFFRMGCEFYEFRL